MMLNFVPCTQAMLGAALALVSHNGRIVPEDTPGQVSWVKGYTFSCGAPAGHICYFSVIDPKGQQVLRIAIPGGSRGVALLPAREALSYTVTVDRNLTGDPTCQTASKAGLFCKHAPVLPGVNN